MHPETPENFGAATETSPVEMTTLNLLAAAPAPQPGKRRPSVKRLLQGDGVNLIAFTFTPGQFLPNHNSAHPITVQCLSGTLDFGCGEETVRMSPGVVLHLREKVMHRVDCPADADSPAILLLSMLTGERHD